MLNCYYSPPPPRSYRMVEEALVTRMTERDSDKSKDRGGE